MPELPEVETVRKSLEKLVIGKRIIRVSVLLPRIIRNPNVAQFKQYLVNTVVSQVSRRGKFLKIICHPWVLVSHLRMEGKYRLANADEPLDKHTHVIFHFLDGTELRYIDVRQFGTMDLISYGDEENQFPLTELGIEPLSDEFSVQWLKERLVHRRSKLKSLLLNQKFIVGLGNIYVDEVLFRANIHPERIALSLKDEEIQLLHLQIKKVLSTAIQAGGASVRTYRNGEGEKGQYQIQIQVYGKKGEPCLRCNNQIQRIIVAGRGTHLCSICQR